MPPGKGGPPAPSRACRSLQPAPVPPPPAMSDPTGAAGASPAATAAKSPPATGGTALAGRPALPWPPIAAAIDRPINTRVANGVARIHEIQKAASRLSATIQEIQSAVSGLATF